MRFTAGCASFAPEKARTDENLARIAEWIVQAGTESVDLLVFPEAAASGYFLEGGLAENAMPAAELAANLNSHLNGKIAKMDVVVGFFESDGGDLFNSAAYLEVRGKDVVVKHVYRKFFLPTYGVFDEERFVSRGHTVDVIPTSFGNLSILICEDVWHSILPTLCAAKGAEILVVPSASPARGFAGEEPGNLERYERLLRGISEEHSLYCLNAMLAGFEGGKGFVGGSAIIDPFGNKVAKSPLLEEHLLVAEINLDQVRHARTRSPLLADLRSAWQDLAAEVESLSF